MTVERYIRIMAGTVVLISLALGYQGSPIFVRLVPCADRLRRLQPGPVRHHRLLSARDPVQKDGRAGRQRFVRHRKMRLI